MKRPTCPRCGIEVAGAQQHQTAEECLRHLTPRYQLAQRSVTALHKRLRNMEGRLERAKLAGRVARKEAKRNATVPARLEAVEAALGLIRKESIRAIA